FDCAPGAPQGAFPRFGGDRAGGIGHVIAGLADCGSRGGTVACDRVNVRDDFLGSSLNALPAREDVLEKIEILRRVHRSARAEAVIADRKSTRLNSSHVKSSYAG